MLAGGSATCCKFEAGGALTSSWRKVSGPGDVTFEHPDQPRTLAFFTEPGEYELELSGSDSELHNTTAVTVIAS